MSTSDPMSFERQFVAFLDTMADEVPSVRYRAPRGMLRRAQARVMATTAAGVMLAAALASGGVLVGRAIHAGHGVVPGSGASGAILTSGSSRSGAGSDRNHVGGMMVGGVPGGGYLAPFGPSGYLGQTRPGPDGGGWDRIPTVPSGGGAGSGGSPGSKQGSPNDGGSSGSSGSSGGGFWWNPPGNSDGGIGLVGPPPPPGHSGSNTGISAEAGVGQFQAEHGSVGDESNAGTTVSPRRARRATGRPQAGRT